MNTSIGDATSQLIQVTAKNVGYKFTASGDGAKDVRRLVCESYNAKLVTDELWKMCQTFGAAIDAAGEMIPESFRAIVSAGILTARSNIDLGRKQ